MNKFLTFLIIVLSFSCSSDNDNNYINSTQEQKVLSKIITTTFLLSEPETVANKYYINNRLVTDTIYSTSNDLWIYTNYFYDDNKLIHRETTNTANQSIEDFYIEYDELGRIIETNFISNSYTINTTFTYNGETIIGLNNNDGEISTKIFHLNSDGIIFKEVNDSGIHEIEYDNNYNVLSLSKPTLITSYIYDNNIIVPENLQFFQNFMLGDYKNNIVLYINNISGAIFSDVSTSFKYHLSVTNENLSSNNVRTDNFEWILDNDNYPISRSTYRENGQLMVAFEYFY